jgi:acyl-CoA thioesterase-1
MGSWISQKLAQRRQLLIGSVLIVAILALVVVATMVEKDNASSAAVTATNKPVGTPKPVKPLDFDDLTTVVWIGDSYTEGSVDGVFDRFAVTIGRDLCWDDYTLAKGGTGYTNPGDPRGGGTIYADRVDEAVDLKPDLVIIQGSTNDKGPGAEAAAIDLYDELEAKIPSAQLVVVGPFDPPGSKNVATRDAIRDAAESRGLTFIDSYGWLNPDEYGDDGVNPNEQGHRVIAAKLTKFLVPEWDAC